jgi:hypothetical protein
MEVDKLICNIIQNEMNTPNGRIMTKTQNWTPPSDNSYYITVGIRSQKIVSSTNKFVPSTEDKEEKAVLTYTTLDINITSKNREAIERKEEIVMALTSTYSQQQQELYHMKIFRTNDILDLSFIEASSGLNRFRISCIVSSIREKQTSIDYYDKFKHEEVIEQ